jgi:4-diphosphocytidyl-2-C-methyl-D-erythritol kinase
MKKAKTFQCAAKVNLALSVGAPNLQGMHPICSWMERVSFYDDLEVTPLPDGEPSAFDIDWAHDAPHKSPIDWNIQSDLVCKAHRVAETFSERPLPVAVALRKRIPVGAGLGGGSSDGATMLLALNELFDLEIGHEDLCEMASHLGSDVPFFVGGPSAIVSGLGEKLEPLPKRETMHLVLMLPSLQCPTGPVYKQFDALNTTAKPENAEAIRSIVQNERVHERWLFNDLTQPACAVEPRLRDLIEHCRNVVGRRVFVTGSGAALFCMAGDAEDARHLVDCLSTGMGIAAVAVTTL